MSSSFESGISPPDGSIVPFSKSESALFISFMSVLLPACIVTTELWSFTLLGTLLELIRNICGVVLEMLFTLLLLFIPVMVFTLVMEFTSVMLFTLR